MPVHCQASSGGSPSFTELHRQSSVYLENTVPGDSDFIFTCVGNDNDLREVTLGDKGLFKTAKKGSIYIDNTTASANIARELYKEAKAKGFDFLDAPISGGQAGAEGGILTVMVGGDETTFKKAEPVIDCYSKKIKLLGPS